MREGGEGDEGDRVFRRRERRVEREREMVVGRRQRDRARASLIITAASLALPRRAARPALPAATVNSALRLPRPRFLAWAGPDAARSVSKYSPFLC